MIAKFVGVGALTEKLSHKLHAVARRPSKG